MKEDLEGSGRDGLGHFSVDILGVALEKPMAGRERTTTAAKKINLVPRGRAGRHAKAMGAPMNQEGVRIRMLGP